MLQRLRAREDWRWADYIILVPTKHSVSYKDDFESGPNPLTYGSCHACGAHPCAAGDARQLRGPYLRSIYTSTLLELNRFSFEGRAARYCVNQNEKPIQSSATATQKLEPGGGLVDTRAIPDYYLRTNKSQW